MAVASVIGVVVALDDEDTAVIVAIVGAVAVLGAALVTAWAGLRIKRLEAKNDQQHQLAQVERERYRKERTRDHENEMRRLDDVVERIDGLGVRVDRLEVVITGHLRMSAAAAIRRAVMDDDAERLVEIADAIERGDLDSLAQVDYTAE